MMGLDYTAIITTIVGLIGGGWLFNLYSAKPRKTSIELENVRKAMEEMNGVINTMKESSRIYSKYFVLQQMVSLERTQKQQLKSFSPRMA